MCINEPQSSMEIDGMKHAARECMKLLLCYMRICLFYLSVLVENFGARILCLVDSKFDTIEINRLAISRKRKKNHKHAKTKTKWNVIFHCRRIACSWKTNFCSLLLLTPNLKYRLRKKHHTHRFRCRFF